MKKKLFFYIIGIALIASCNNSDLSQNKTQDSIAYQSQTEDSLVVLESDDSENRITRVFGDSITKIEASFSFIGTVFDIGSGTHFNECKFIFECDCCAGILLLHKDSVFYHVSDCMGDLTITRGNFSIHKDKIHFTSDGIRIDKQYDPSKESVPNQEEEWSLVHDITEPYEMIFQIKSCNLKPLLVDYRKDYTSIASLSDLKVKEELMKLEKDGVLSRFDEVVAE